MSGIGPDAEEEETEMYETNEYVTVQQGGVHRRPSQRIWLALIPTVAALVALLLVLGAACRSRSADEAASRDAVTATPSPSVEASPSPDPSESAESAPETGTGGGSEDGSGSGGNSGGGSSGGGEPAAPEEPQPLAIGAMLTTPPAVGGCTASGQVTTTGGDAEEYPLTLTYRWFWMPITEPLSQMPPPVQFGGDTDIHFTGPAEVGVTSPAFPEDEDAVKHRVLLQVSGDGNEVDSDWKVYGCGVEIAQTQ